MSGSAKGWIFIALFFAGFLAATIGELYWLSKKRGIGIRRAMIFVFSSNFTTITLGFFISFVIFGLVLAVAWDQATEMPGGEAGWVLALMAMTLFPILLMAGMRLLLYRTLNFRDAAADIPGPLKYSLLTTLLFFLMVVIVPTAFLYIF